MSALAGFWSLTGQPSAARCGAMLSSQLAYGPDGSAAVSLGNISLGRNLFALLPDDDADRQPLVGGDGRFALVADVRLDNRDELGAALGLGANEARSMADSEILFRALERWGEGTPTHLLGDFAFAWFDNRDHRLILARDPLGQRPLFWRRGRDFIAFSSMPVGLHALEEIDREPDKDAVARWLANFPPKPAQSFFSGLERVPPGHVVSITEKGETRRRYWNPERRPLKLSSFDDYVEAYRFELERAVRSRLRTRAPVVASHLSGGWDSGAVTATAARIGSGPVVAFTAVPRRDCRTSAPRNRFADEGPAAAAVAAMHSSIEHHLMESDGASPLAQLDEGVRLFERPLFNLCNHGWLAQIRRSARQRGAQVLLTGEIGNWTISAAPLDLLAEYLRTGEWKMWRSAAHGLTTSGQARWRGILAASLRPWIPAAAKQRLSSIHSYPELSPALRPDLREALRAERKGQGSDRFADTVGALSAMDFGEYRKGILGGWGIDKRDATADVRLVEFTLSLPAEMLLDSGGRRPLARAALADRLPPEVLAAPGKGYQGADWHSRLTRDLPRVRALVDAIADNAAASSVIDVDRLRVLLCKWPHDKCDSPAVITSYRNTFLQALTAGHFCIRASGGKLPW